MTTPPNWRDLAQQQNPDPASAPQGAVTWRNLAAQSPAPDEGGQPGAAGAAPATSPAPAAPGPAPAPTPAPGPEGAWAAPAAEQVSPVTPQAAPSPSAPVDPAEASAALGMNIAAAGGAATDVDAAQLLAYIRNLEARFEALQADQRQAQAPEVVKYATALADHLQAKADANPVVNADPDHTYYPALVKAAQLVNGAEQVVKSGTGHEQLVTMAKDVAGWVGQHARRFPAIDYDYVLQLVEEVAGAAVKLGL